MHNLEELKRLREEKKAAALEAKNSILQRIEPVIHDIDVIIKDGIWASQVVIPLQITYLAAAAEFRKKARELRDGVYTAKSNLLDYLKQKEEILSTAIKDAIEKSRGKKDQLEKRLNALKESVAHSFERARNSIIKAATEKPEEIKTKLASTFTRLASRINTAAKRCEKIVNDYKERAVNTITTALTGAKAKIAAILGKIENDMDEETYYVKLALAHPSNQPLMALAFTGLQRKASIQDAVKAVMILEKGGEEAEVLRSAMNYVQTLAQKKARERLITAVKNYMPDAQQEEIEKIVEYVITSTVCPLPEIKTAAQTEHALNKQENKTAIPKFHAGNDELENKLIDELIQKRTKILHRVTI